MAHAQQHPTRARRRFSYSAIDCWEQCPAKWAHRYVHKTPGRGFGPAAARGTACHAVCEEIIRRHCKAKRSGMIDEAGEIPDLLRDAWAAEGMPGDANDFGEALGWLRRWAAIESPLSYQTVMGVEVGFAIEVRGVRLSGKIDRVDRIGDQVRVIDYKTNFMPYSRDEVALALQLTIYAIAACEMYGVGVDNVDLVYWMLRHGYTQTSTRTTAQIEAAGLYLDALTRIIEAADHYPPQLNTFCGWCDYRATCPAYQQAADAPASLELRPYDVELAAAERTKWAAAEKAAKARKGEAEKVLRGWMNRGDVTAAGRRYYYIEQTSHRYDTTDTLRQLAARTGRDPLEIAGEICTIKDKPLREWIDTLDDLARGEQLVLQEELASLATPTVSKRFGSSKARKV